MSSIRRGLIYSTFSRYLLKVIGLVSTVLIARLLTPSEVGTYAIASSIVMLLAEVRLLGANAYLERETDLDETKIRRAYGLTIIMSWGLGIVLALSSYQIGVFFNNSDVGNLFLILALNFIFAPYVSVPYSFLARKFMFKEIMYTLIVAAIVQFAITISMAYMNYGVYALAWGHTLGIIAQMLLGLYLTRDTPIYIPEFSGLKSIARVGVYTSISNILKKTQYTSSDLVIGRLGTSAEVGYFSRGMGLVDFVSQSVMSGIGPVIQPFFTDTSRKGMNLVTAYTNATSLALTIFWPLMAVVGYSSLPAIRLLFGEQWDFAAPVASVLSAWLIIKYSHVFSYNLLLALHLEKVIFKRELSVFIMLVPSIIFAYQYGLVASAYAFVFVSIIELLLTVVMLKKYVGLSFYSYFASLLRPALIAIGCLSIFILLDFYLGFNEQKPWIVFIILALTYPIVWLLFCYLTKSEIVAEIKKFF